MRNMLTKLSQKVLAIAVVVTIGAIALWQMTGGDYYTKFEVIQEVEKAVDPDDPLAGTGFYEDDKQVETIARKEFRFGLLPTPSGLFDKHLLSVASVVTPFWALTLIVVWRERRTRSSS